MVTTKTNGVQVSVETYYQDHLSNVAKRYFVFTYNINIVNNNPFKIKLLSRYWDISDSIGTNHVVEGDGVIGQQPVLNLNESHQYVSGCNLYSEVGKMKGYYTFLNLEDNTTFRVKVPEFVMICPWKLN